MQNDNNSTCTNTVRVIDIMPTIHMRDSGEYLNFNEFRINKIFPDVVIKIKDRSFPCHRIILAASMKYFQSMFCGEYVEAKKKEIKLEWNDAEDFEKLLTYIYGASVPVSEINVYGLLKIGHYFGSLSLEELCANYIVKNSSLFSSDSIARVFRYACKIRNTILLSGLSPFIAENFSEFFKCKKLYYLPGSDLFEILSESHLNESYFQDSTTYLDFLSNWLKVHDVKDRELLPDLLGEMGLKEGPWKTWIFNSIWNNAALLNTEEGDDLSIESEEEKEEEEAEAETLPFLFTTQDLDTASIKHINTYKFRPGNEALRFVKSRLDDNDLPYACDDNLYCKSVSINKAQFTVLSYSHLRENLNDQDYAVRILSVFASSTLETLDCRAKKMKSRSINYNHLLFTNDERYVDGNIFSMVVPANGNNIYLYDNFEFVMYNCDVNNWFKVCENHEQYVVFAPNLLSRGDHSLYIVGGKRLNSTTPVGLNHTGTLSYMMETDGKTNLHFDIRTKMFSQLPKMKYSRSKAASCMYKDIIYVSGGDDLVYHNNHNVEWYDIKAGKWNEFSTPMPRPLMGHCLAVYDDQLWFLGGGHKDTCNEWFSYNLKKQTWSEIYSFPNTYGRFDIQRILDVEVTD